jgi:hypothetical protein
MGKHFDAPIGIENPLSTTANAMRTPEIASF